MAHEIQAVLLRKTQGPHGSEQSRTIGKGYIGVRRGRPIYSRYYWLIYYWWWWWWSTKRTHCNYKRRDSLASHRFALPLRNQITFCKFLACLCRIRLCMVSQGKAKQSSLKSALSSMQYKLWKFNLTHWNIYFWTKNNSPDPLSCFVLRMF